MQMTRETAPSHLIRACEFGRIRIGERWLTSNLIVTADEIVSDWSPSSPARITVDDLAPALALEPELIVVGAGFEPQSPNVDLMAELAARAVGLEYMATDAACRTFNVLLSEGRRVAAALLLAAGST
jgi:uncharacterized protein